MNDLPAKNNLKRLLYWMEERQRIYLKRRDGSCPPWTHDPILRKYRFCNVYREQDKVTQWIRVNWRVPYKNHQNLWFAMCVARQINWPETLGAIGGAIGFPDEWDPNRVLRIMRQRAEKGLKNYSGAYMLTAGGGNRGVDKPYITVKKILDPLYKVWKNGDLPPWELNGVASLEESCKWLRHFYGFGPFIAYEVVTDLRHTWCLEGAKDIHTWANPGPGARRGLNRLYNRPLRNPTPPDQMIGEMNAILHALNGSRNRFVLPTLEMRDVEHSLCEYDKYMRAKEAEEQGLRIGLDRFQPGLVA